MNKKKKKQNGFTIVELVIVIAVIGILAAILIPTFSNLVKKAKQSADQQLVYHINEAVVANEVDNLAKGKNGTEATMYDTLQALENDYGFTIEKMTPRSGNDIIWDSVTNRFALVAKDGTIVYDDPNKPSDMTNKAKMWRITEAGETLGDGYSHYLKAGWSGVVPTVSTGLDVGDNDDITAVTYDSSSDASAVVRTNGGTLTVKAPNGTVNHYGEADKVDVQAVANASYHENGVVKLIAVKKGHVELEGKAEVNGIYVYNESTATEKDTSFEDIKITVNKGVDVPKFSRSAVEVQPEGTKVCTVVTDQAKDIYLFNEGIYEQIKTVDAGKNVASDTSATWADNSAKNTENTQTAAMQLANEFNGTYDTEGKIADQEVVVTGDNAGTYTVKFNEDTREFETYLGEDKVTTEAVVEAVAEVADVANDSGKTADEAEKASALKGTGTQADPFLIYDYETMQMISEFYDKGYYYFEVALDKTDNGKIDLSNNVYISLNGSFDGKGVIFTHVNGGMFGAIGTYDPSDNKPVILKNFTVQNEGGWGIVQECGATTLEFNNINVTGYSLHNWNAGEFLRYGSGEGFNYTVNFVNCSCNAEIYSTQNAWSTILVGHTYPGGSAVATINVDTYTDEHINDSVLYYTGTGTSEGHKYYGMGGVKVYVNGVEKNANDNKVAVGKIVRVDATKNPTKTESGYSINTQSDTRKIVVTLLWQYTEWEENYTAQIPDRNGVGGTIGKTLTFEVDGSADVKVFDTITSVEVRTSSDKWDYELKDGKLIIYMQNTNTYIDGNLSLFVEQYTSGSNIAKYKGSLNIASKTTSSEWVIK